MLEQTRNCMTCGQPLHPGALFCGACGAAVDAAGLNEAVPSPNANLVRSGTMYVPKWLVGAAALLMLGLVGLVIYLSDSGGGTMFAGGTGVGSPTIREGTDIALKEVRALIANNLSARKQLADPAMEWPKAWENSYGETASRLQGCSVDGALTSMEQQGTSANVRVVFRQPCGRGYVAGQQIRQCMIGLTLLAGRWYVAGPLANSCT